MAIGNATGTCFKKRKSWKLYCTTLPNLVTEGHSFMVPFGYRVYSSLNSVGYYNSAVSGNKVSDIVARAATIDSKLVEETTAIKNVLVLWIGANDIDNTEGKGLSTYNDLKTYVQARSAAGWGRIFVFTVTPTTYGGRGAQFEAERDIFNNLLRTDLVSIGGVKIVDTDTIPEMDNVADLDYYIDTLHPSGYGHSLCLNLFMSVYRRAFRLKEEVEVHGFLSCRKASRQEEPV